MTPALHAYPDPTLAAEACAAHVEKALRQELDQADSAALAVSGGSSPKPMFAKLAAAGLPWERIHLFWVDERPVSPDDPQSNFRMANEALVRPAAIPAANVHRIHAELGPEEAARRYEDDLRSHFRPSPGELPRFTVLHLGMGPDAHTASLFPGEPLIDDRERWVAAVPVAKLNQTRITLLPAVLLAARDIVFLASGEDKAAPLRAVLEGPLNLRELPSQVVARSGRPVSWYVDRTAAGLAAGVS